MNSRKKPKKTDLFLFAEGMVWLKNAIKSQSYKTFVYSLSNNFAIFAAKLGHFITDDFFKCNKHISLNANIRKLKKSFSYMMRKYNDCLFFFIVNNIILKINKN